MQDLDLFYNEFVHLLAQMIYTLNSSYRSWFYFGVRGYTPGRLMKINIMNMNRQSKLYSQGYSPIYKVLPQKPHWDRIKERCSFEVQFSFFLFTYAFLLKRFIITLIPVLHKRQFCHDYNLI